MWSLGTDAERTIGAMMGVAKGIVALGFAEVGPYILIAPAAAAFEIAPAVIIFRASAGKDLGVDRTAAAKHPGLWIDHLPSADLAAGDRLVPPDQRTGGHLEEAHGQMDVHVVVARAGFEQGHRNIGILAQARSQ